MEIGWDDYIGDGLNVKWAKVISDLENFSEVIIRRCYFRFDVKDPIKYLYICMGFPIAQKKHTQPVCI